MEGVNDEGPHLVKRHCTRDQSATIQDAKSSGPKTRDYGEIRTLQAPASTRLLAAD